MASRKRTSRPVKRGEPGAVVAQTSPQTSPSTTIGTPMSDSLSQAAQQRDRGRVGLGSSIALK